MMFCLFVFGMVLLGAIAAYLKIMEIISVDCNDEPPLLPMIIFSTISTVVVYFFNMFVIRYTEAEIYTFLYGEDVAQIIFAIFRI